jgi:hypothetical protein
LEKENKDMKKVLFVIGVLSLSACQQLQHGQMQPVKKISARDQTYFTTCAGAVEGWSDCYEKASMTCNKNYSILDKVDNNRGTQRELTFKCN